MYQTKYVAIGGVEWEQSWTSNPYITTTGGVVLGGHAIRIVGMKIMSDGRYAVLANTWSEQVGDKGYWYIREDVFNKKFSEYGIYILSDSQDINVKMLGLISALYTNILTLLKNFSPLILLK
jgi:aminopeptidase C